MSYLHAGAARVFGPLLATAMATLATGCEAGISGSAGAPVVETSQVEVAPVVVASGDVDADVVYEPQPPVVDIETYPYVVYGGVNVYFVGGRWYRHGGDGWGYFRNEPPELGRQREMHDHDARWTRAAQARGRMEPERAGAAEHPAPERSAPERAGVAEHQAPERATPSESRASPPPTKGAVEAKKKAAKKVAPARAAPAKEPSEKEERR